MAVPGRAIRITYSDERETLARFLGIDPGHLAFAMQKHSDQIRTVTSSGPAGECDSLVTSDPNIVLSIQVADCVPVFLHDPVSRTTGLVHAGWRGTAISVTRKTVDEMANLFGSRPEEIEAFLGPSIRACCYKVEEDAASRFSEQFLEQRDGNHLFLNLAKANLQQLTEGGVLRENIREDDRCTFCHGGGFQSYRRDGHRAGRMLCLMSAT
ncbi:MAG: peptidoglycan editing factor PgeF [Candidatus Neomarinimicrobiota bacterium]